MNIQAIEAWASAHPWLWAFAVGTGIPAFLSALAEGVRKGGKADTVWGATLIALCNDGLEAMRARKRLSEAPKP